MLSCEFWSSSVQSNSKWLLLFDKTRSLMILGTRFCHFRHIQRRIQNPVEHLTWSFREKSSIVDVGLGSKYASKIKLDFSCILFHASVLPPVIDTWLAPIHSSLFSQRFTSFWQNQNCNLSYSWCTPLLFETLKSIHHILSPWLV